MSPLFWLYSFAGILLWWLFDELSPIHPNLTAYSNKLLSYVIAVRMDWAQLGADSHIVSLGEY